MINDLNLTVLGNYNFDEINIQDYIPTERSLRKIYGVDIWDYGGCIVPTIIFKKIRLLNIRDFDVTIKTIRVYYEYY